MINCVAIDDEPLALVIIEELCKNIPEIVLKRTFTKLSAANMYLSEFPVDLIFLDIQMPHQNGIDFYKEIGMDTLVVFTTAYPKFAIQGFEVNALDYLLKPIDPIRFKESCMRAKAFIETIKKEDYISVRSEYALVKIDLEKITHIETMDDYLKIYLENSKPIITLMSLKKMLEKLPNHLFSRVHRSYIVSLSKIVSVRANVIHIESSEIPIGSSYRSEFLAKFDS